jgi:hypothetical protein
MSFMKHVIGVLATAALSACQNVSPDATTEKTACVIYRDDAPSAQVTLFATEGDYLDFSAAARRGARDQAAEALRRGRRVAANTALSVLAKGVGGHPYRLRGPDGETLFLDPSECH